MPKKNKGGQNADPATHEQGIITMNEGWERISSVGIVPFFERLEKLVSQNDFDARSIPQQQYILTYDTIFTMCIQREPYNFSAPLYLRHSEALVEYYKQNFKPVLEEAKQQHGLVFLREWVKRWRCNKWSVDGMQRMFMYLDRFHVPNSEDLLNTSEQGYTLFRKYVFEDYKEPAREAILTHIRRERDGEEQDRDLLRDSIAVFVELGHKLKKVDLQIYKEDFQKYLVVETREYYTQKSRMWLDQYSCPDYLLQAEQCVNSELGRLQSYIDKSSTEGLMTATREELLKKHQTELLDKETGINKMLERTNEIDSVVAKEDLSRLYRLYQEVPGGVQNISEAMKVHIASLGLGFIEKSKEDDQGGSKDHALIRQLIDLHDRFLTIVKTNFEGDQVFHKALKEAFEDFINKEYYTSNFLARYANDILKKGSRVAVTDLENTMEHVVMLYGYIRDKDIFERDYQQFLAHRLLQDLSENEQSEKTMIGKLKTESGYHWTSKLEDMFKDIQRSKELMEDFQNNYGSEFAVELSVSVCTTGAWPTSSIPPVRHPEDIMDVSERFRQFYLNRHSGRKLNYRMDQGKADVRIAFNPKTVKTVVVTTYQMMILLLFNAKQTLTLAQILEQTGIPRDDCLTHLLSLAHPKIKILRKNPNTKECEDNHKFQINPKYKNNRARIVIPLMARVKASNTRENPAEQEAIQRLRRHQMDAAIVRIMKARKKSKHADLVAEVVKQLRARFTPKPTDIKKRIANLIELDYLERDENDRTTYHYKM